MTHPELCVDVLGGIGSGRRVGLWPCHGGDNQRWYIAEGNPNRDFPITGASSDPFYELVVGINKPGLLPGTNKGLCLDIRGGTDYVKRHGSGQMIAYKCKRGFGPEVDNQRWTFK